MKQIGFDSISDGSEAELHPHPGIHHLGATPKNQVLIATDVISRGIDVPQVRMKGVPPCGLQHAFIRPR